MKKNSILFFLTFFILNISVAQEKTRINEIGLYFTDFDNFGVRYKTGNDNLLFRITALSLNALKSRSQNEGGVYFNETISGLGFNLGIEKPIKVNEKFNLYYGAELRNSFFYQKVDYGNPNQPEVKTNNFGIGLGFVMGVSYYLKPDIKISAELIPGINYNHNNSDGNKTNTFNLGFTNNLPGITLSYKF